MLKLVPYSLLIKIAIIILEYLVTRTENDLDNRILEGVKNALKVS